MLNNKYDPRLKKIDELEATFACGENILNELMDELEPGKGNELTRQSWITTGARGAGKSHLLALLYHRIKEDETLSKYWLPLLFPEELFGVDSMYRLLLQVFEYLFKVDTTPVVFREIQKEFLEIRKVRITGNLKQKKETRHQLAKQLFQLLVKTKKVTGKTFILMLENLQYLLREQLSEGDIKHLRAFMNEHPEVFIIIGTALTVFDEISDYGKPFFHFFRVRSMENLGRQEIINFLLQLGDFSKDKGIREKIETNRRYIYLYQLLTGGNPRLILFLYELLLDNEILDTYMILGKITELTPYFLDKTKDESGQRKLILDALATEAPAQTAGEIAEYVNEDYKSIAEQLKRLAAEGWIREITINAENAKRNEVFYTLRDYFYRVWYKTRTKGIEESDIACMAELTVFLFQRKEIEERLKKYAGLNNDMGLFYAKSLELAVSETFMKNINLLLEEAQEYEVKEVVEVKTEIGKCLINEDWKKLIEHAEKLLHYPNEALWAHTWLGLGFKSIGNYEQSLEHYKKVLEIKSDYWLGWYGTALYHLKTSNLDDFYNALSKAIQYSPKPDIFLLQHTIFESLKIGSHRVFNSSKELQYLLDENSPLSIKLESLCRLLLLGKFSTITDAVEYLLEEPDLPEVETKKLDLLLEIEILDILKNRPQDPALKLYFKYWIHLICKRYDTQTIRKKFLQIIYFHINWEGKGNISLEPVESAIQELYEKGIEVSDVILKILAAVKNPRTRTAQQWMVDPLFAEVVRMLSEESNETE